MTPDQGTTSGQQSHPDQLQPREPGAGRRHGARGAVRLAADAARRTGGRSRRARRRASREGRSPSRSVVATAISIGGQRFDAAARSDARSASTRASGRCSARPCRASTCAAMVTGQFEFVHNVRVPGHAARPRRAAAGGRRHARRASTRARSASMPGLVKVVVKKQLRRRRRARNRGRRCRRRARCKVTWTPGTAAAAAARPVLSASATAARARHAARGLAATSTRRWRRRPPCCGRPITTRTRCTASMGTSCAVADVQGDKATIWSATQSAFPTRNTSAMLLGLPAGERARHLRARRPAATASTAPTR